MEKAHIIAGGGLAGLFAARVLVNNGVSHIYVIERDSEIGGLMQSVRVKNPKNSNAICSFDYGTHFILNPAKSAVYETVRHDLENIEYDVFKDSLPEASYINGALYKNSGCANATLFSEDIQEQILNEMEQLKQAAHSNQETPKTLQQVLQKKYGDTAIANIYAPAYKKMAGLGPEELDPLTENSFFPSRLILKDNETSKQLKQDPFWDTRLAYTSYKDSTSPIEKYYPKSGGVGIWLETMAKNLESEGVTILRNTSIERLKTESNQVTEVTLNTNESISCESLVWTLPPIFLCHMTDTTARSERPRMRSVAILHYLIDQKPLIDEFWVTVYDPNMLSYRITLYDNFTTTEHQQHQISVEILHDGEFNGDEADQAKIFDELKRMRVIAEDAAAVLSLSTNKPNGFPVLTPSLKDAQIEQLSALETKFDNIYIVGRRPDGGHGQLSVMSNIYERLQLLKPNDAQIKNHA